MRPPRIRLALLVAFAVGLATPSLRAQSPEEFAATARAIASNQNDDGGFGPSKGESSTLPATSTSIRILKYAGGSIPDVAKCRAYVLSCLDGDSGGFAATPGGMPDPNTTASGLMALAELGLATPERVEPAVDFLGKKAESFEEIRLAIAGCEAVAAKVPEPDAWFEAISRGRNDDGTWGEGGATAFETGGRAAAILRMGRDLENREAILDAIKGGQNPDGGWSKDGGPSDLSSTYRVMRALYMMKETPDLDRLRGFLASCRQDNSTYAPAPGKPGDLGGTYFATTVGSWARRLHGEPPLVEIAAFQPLFDGQSLEGWDGDKTLWKVEDGMIVGDSPGIKQNEFLVAPGTYGDFILKFSFRLKGGEGNSGVQFRSERVPDSSEMTGYQADIGEGYWGCLYDESRRNRVLVQASERAQAAVNKDGWNHYVIRCMGDQITLTLNDVTSVQYREQDEGIAADGRIGLQIHSGGPMRIEFKDLYIQPIPTPAECDDPTFGFHLRKVKVGDAERPYTVFLPEGYDPQEKYPVVLFLHGSGERGEGGIRSAQVGLGAAIAGRAQQFPLIAVFPQAREGWRAGSDDARYALAALDAVMSDYSTDPDRVILTGLSMGGFGTWQLASTEPHRWAAIVPVCGFAEPEVVAPIVEARLPVRSYIGDADMPRLLTSTRQLVAALRDAGAPVTETEYRGVGHNSWDRAYSDPDLIPWMLQQRRPSR